MLRPIDAVFRHPVKKFTVIYQNGKLWQLPQLDFDGGSLAYKRPYTGSREQIFVAQNQQLNPADTLLLSKLATISLPATVVGANVDEFEHWWAKKSYDYRAEVAQSKAIQQQAIATLASNSPTSLTPKSAITQPAIPQPAIPQPPSFNTPAPHISQSPPSPAMTAKAGMSVPSSDEGDLFDSMLADLTKDLH